MRFEVLGAVTARDHQDRELDLGTGRAATLLALLVAQREAPLSPARLADQLWSGRPPATAATTLQGWISRLRRRLEPGVPAARAQLLVTRSVGYQLVLTDPVGQLDAAAFHRDAATLDVQLRAGRPDLAAAAGRAALARWHGDEPYGGLLDEALPEEPGRLREERRLVTERLALARLDLGDHVSLLGELAAAVSAEPTRESLWAMRVLALYRADRQADALAALTRVRGLLRDELGLDPGATLRAVETAVRRADPAAAAPGWWPGRRPVADAAGRPTATTGGPVITVPSSRPVSPFVGRAAELKRMSTVLATLPADADADADAGGGSGSGGRGGAEAGARSLVVSGPAGAGKTRLLAELLAPSPSTTAPPGLARPRWVRCHPGDDAPPYDLWRRLFPELAAPPDASTRSWAFAVTAAVSADDRSSHAPSGRATVIVVDDLQWADAASLRVLAIVVRELAGRPALFAATVRDDYLGGAGEPVGAERSGGDRSDDDPVVAALGALGRLPGDHLRVGPLAPAAVAEYVAAVVPGATWDDPGAVAALVAERCGGNAFFMTELTRLVAAGRPAADLPERVVDVVSSRVAELGEPARGLLRVAAVLGEDVPADVAGQVAAVADAGRLDEALDVAARAGLVVDEPGVVRFAHALVREGLAARTPPRVQASWHRRCADLLQSRGAGVQAVADHLLRGDDPRAAAAALAAASAALAVADFDGAVGWARRGLERAPAADAPLRVRLGLAAGRALRRAGRLAEADALLAGTQDDALLAGEVDLAALAALERSGGPVTGYWSMAGETSPDLRALLTVARELPGLGTAVAGALDAACAARFALAGDVERARRHLAAAQAAFDATTERPRPAAGNGPSPSSPAVEVGPGATAWASADLAEVHGLEQMVLLAQFLTWWLPDLAVRRLAVLDRLGELAGDDVGARLTVTHLRALTLLELGELERADGQARLLAATASRLRYDDFTLVAAWWRAMRDLMSGRLDEAIEAAESVFSPLLVASPEAAVVARTSVEAIGGMVAWEGGALADILPGPEEAPPTDHAGWLIVRGLGLAQAGHIGDSLAALASVLRPGLPALGSGPVATSSLILLTEWCWHARSSARAREWARPLLDRVEAWADAVIVFAPGGVCMGSGHLYVGTLAAILGDRERARRELGAAIAVHERLDMPRFAARARERAEAVG